MYRSRSVEISLFSSMCLVFFICPVVNDNSSVQPFPLTECSLLLTTGIHLELVAVRKRKTKSKVRRRKLNWILKALVFRYYLEEYF